MRESTEWGFQGVPAIAFSGMNFVSEDAALMWLSNPACWNDGAIPSEVIDRMRPTTGSQVYQFLLNAFYLPGMASVVRNTKGEVLVPSTNKERVTAALPFIESYPEEDQMLVLGISLALMGGDYDFDTQLIGSWSGYLPMAFRLLVAGVSPLAVSDAFEHDIDVELMSAIA